MEPSRVHRRLRSIIEGQVPVSMHLDFMYSANHADLQILKNMKEKVEVCGLCVGSYASPAMISPCCLPVISAFGSCMRHAVHAPELQLGVPNNECGSNLIN